MNKLTAFIERIHLISAFLEYVGVSNGNVITLCLYRSSLDRMVNG